MVFPTGLSAWFAYCQIRLRVLCASIEDQIGAAVVEDTFCVVSEKRKLQTQCVTTILVYPTLMVAFVQAVIGRTEESILGRQQPSAESQITFPSGERMKLRQLGVYLRVIVDAMQTYDLFSVSPLIDAWKT